MLAKSIYLLSTETGRIRGFWEKPPGFAWAECLNITRVDRNDLREEWCSSWTRRRRPPSRRLKIRIHQAVEPPGALHDQRTLSRPAARHRLVTRQLTLFHLEILLRRNRIYNAVWIKHTTLNTVVDTCLCELSRRFDLFRVEVWDIILFVLDALLFFKVMFLSSRFLDGFS